ncbi:hypothetical protein ACR78Z_06400 [Sphingobacterium thalpophilum]|uniref:Uncharacterized protein n=1 Tax=Sphingobacterium thalpophilum TaxID=259 RepID=A0A4U9VT34_9SPHI|nr:MULTISPECIES: hypothetical protein [Sphingobacterium]MCW8313277.1 hypothetical protein [Sphingobacterium sp. InxBP1]VTR50626.1 Uncharacterised protein [Sphingobacterium thalpophilum]
MKTQTNFKTTRTGKGNTVLNKNNLDSRESTENMFKGEDITHNKKEIRSENKKKDTK